MADTNISSSSSSDDDVNSSIDEHNHSISAAETCKKPKMTDITTTVGDFISGLPDAILCHILSYIPTKPAVATSVLSKRWNQVWTSVPNLDFIDRSWYVHIPHTPVIKTLFLNFVDRVLSLNNVSCVRKICIHCNEYFDSSRVNSLITAVRMRDMEEFDLRLPESCLIQNLDQTSRIHSLPDSFFARKNLVLLSLQNIALKVPKSVYFPSLKTIHFVSVQLLDDDSMQNLLSGCPVLLKLDIYRWTWDNAQTIYISSSTLDILSLHTQYCNRDFGYKVVIDTPNLSTLHLTDEVDADYDIINLSSLVKVEVGVELDERGRVQTDGEVFYARLFEILRKMSHVEDLCFACRTMNSFQYTLLDNLPKFNNLTSMKVELISEGWSILPDLFHCAPNLVNFFLYKDDVHPHCDWYQPNVVPQCFLSTLKNVEIVYFEECDEEMEMIYYFLKNAMVLKKLSINSYSLNLEKETNILKRLLTLPRSSSICQIDYTNSRW